MGVLRLCPGKTRRPGSSTGWERVVRAGPQGTYLVPPQTFCPLAGQPSGNITTTPKSPPALECPSPWLPMYTEEKPLRVLRPEASAKRGMELTTACRYFSCSRLLESA